MKGTQPELSKQFSDRGMDYECMIMSRWAAMYKVTAIHDDDFVCFDVFRFGNLKPIEGSLDCLYPDDDAFVFDTEVDSYSGEKCMENDLFQEAVMRFKVLGYMM